MSNAASLLDSERRGQLAFLDLVRACIGEREYFLKLIIYTKNVD